MVAGVVAGLKPLDTVGTKVAGVTSIWPSDICDKGARDGAATVVTLGTADAGWLVTEAQGVVPTWG